MGIYIGDKECRVIYVARNGQQRRVSSVWVGDQQIFPPANRQEIHLFTRDTQGYGRREDSDRYLFSVPMPWWATNMDVVMIGAGEKGRDGTKSFSGGSDGAGGRSGAWVVKTVSVPNAPGVYVTIGKGNSESPHYTEIIFPNEDGGNVRIRDEEGSRTTNSGSTGGSVTPRSRTEFDNVHIGGQGGGRNSPGTHPGGGGGGGQGSNLLGNPTSGRDGGDGYVWLRFRSNAPIGGGGFTLYLGVTAGYAFQPLRDWAASIGKTHETITEITVPVSIVGPVMDNAFESCRSLVTAPEMDTSQVTSAGGMFSYCTSLVTIPPLDMRKVKQIGFMLYGCSSLESVTLPGMGNGFTTAQTLDMRDTILRREAAEELMRSLGTIPAAASGSVIKFPPSAAGADGGIAMDKNWRVTFG